MMKRFALGTLLVATLTGQSSLAKSESGRLVEAGAVANSWIQGGLRVTDHLLDLAIQGRGFFALTLPDGGRVFSRHGAFYLDRQGYLSHKQLGGRLVTEPMNVGEALTKHASELKGMRINLDGTVEGVYADGHVIKVAWLNLAAFQNARKLERRGEHQLWPTQESGEPFYGHPQTGPFGSVYAASLEELDGIYENSLD